ncbi:MAG: ATPase domain-containing protein [Minicystis sp.]
MSDVDQPRDLTLDRFPSGVPGLDVILGGGFLRKSTYIIMGAPGAGKTILGNQICFHHVASGGRALYVTLLAESHARMIAHLRSMRFFDPKPIAEALKYMSGYRVLEEHGLGGLLDLMRKLIREHQATLLVVDGLVSAHAFANDDLAFKKFIHGLNTLVPFLDCTTFLLTNGPTNTISPEHTMVDGLVELSDPLIGLRAVRELSVRKFRGSNHLRGKHAFEISSEGVTVFPRLESLVTASPSVPQERAKLLPFGVPGLDEMLEGGVPAGTTTMLLGPSGSGKTILGLSFLAAGARAGESGLYFGFFESPPRVIAKGDNLGLDLGAHVRSGILAMEWQPPAELILDEAAHRLLALVRGRRVRRLVIDGLSAFHSMALYPRRLARFVAALANELRGLDVTTIFSQETQVLFGPGISAPVAGLSAIAENILFLRQVEHRSRLKRVLSIVKTREHDHQADIREFTISSRGLEIGAPLGENVEAILTGIVRSRAVVRAPPERSSLGAEDEGEKPRPRARKPR